MALPSLGPGSSPAATVRSSASGGAGHETAPPAAADAEPPAPCADEAVGRSITRDPRPLATTATATRPTARPRSTSIRVRDPLLAAFICPPDARTYCRTEA